MALTPSWSLPGDDLVSRYSVGSRLHRLIYNGSYITLNGLNSDALRRMSGTTAVNREGEEDTLEGAILEGTALEEF